MSPDKPEVSAYREGHYTVAVTNLSPTELVCACGRLFAGGDVLQKMRDHMRGDDDDR